MANLDQIMELRRKLGVSLLELAARSGLPENYLSKIEAGEIQPLDSDLLRLEKALRGSKNPFRGFNDFKP